MQTGNFKRLAVILVASISLISAASVGASEWPRLVRVSNLTPRILAYPAAYFGNQQIQETDNSLAHCECCDSCNGSPDHSWARVAKWPIQRKSVEYMRYWPDNWYGQRRIGRAKLIRRFPMVAEPVDTTQLGYYFHNVPRWKPNPSMLPKPPRCSTLHVRKRAL